MSYDHDVDSKDEDLRLGAGILDDFNFETTQKNMRMGSFGDNSYGAICPTNKSRRYDQFADDRNTLRPGFSRDNLNKLEMDSKNKDKIIP